MSPRASIVIPTWNGAQHLRTCLAALAAQTFTDGEILVVDNGSTDETPAVLAAHPSVRCLPWAENRGFAAACNAGIRATTGAIVVLLNNDTSPAPDWMGALVAALDADPGAGMAQPKVRLMDRPEILHTTGDTVNLAGIAANRGVWELDRGQWDTQRDVFGANAAAAAYRRVMFDDVGLFEERFGSYLEDVDLAWRARLRGWRCLYVPEALVYHKVSATGGGPLASYLVARNRWWLLARCYPGRLLVRHLGPVLAAQARITASAARSWRGAAARATLRGQAVGALSWPRMLAARRAIQTRRKVDDATLERWLAEATQPPRQDAPAPPGVKGRP